LAGGRIAAAVEVTITDDSDADPLSVRSPIIFLALTARSTFFTAEVEKTSKALAKDSIVHSIVLTYQAAFFGTFRTQREEAGWRAGGARYGSILMAYFPDLPKEWELYATLFDLSYKLTGGRAVATKVDSQGLPQLVFSPVATSAI
jgi:hypothetical protein